MELANKKSGAALAALALWAVIGTGTAHASPQVLGAAVGGGLGAAVGGQVGGPNGAIVGGAVGAAAGAALAGQPYYGRGPVGGVYAPGARVVPAPVYMAPSPAYAAPVYVAPPPMVVRRAPVYVVPATVYGPPVGYYAYGEGRGKRWKHWKHSHGGPGYWQGRRGWRGDD